MWKCVSYVHWPAITEFNKVSQFNKSYPPLACSQVLCKALRYFYDIVYWDQILIFIFSKQ